jgi:uncharacterized protein (TIGR03118 family)
MKRLPECLFILVLALTIAFLPVHGLHAAGNFYQQHNLVSDGATPADHIDPNLVNAWGIVFNPNTFVWVADNGTGVATLYDGAGLPQSLVVTIPPPPTSAGPSAPTGIVFNGSSDFVVTKGVVSSASVFIFATEDGTISGWAPSVDAKNGILMVDNSGSGAVYKGLALAANGTGHFLYATNFRKATIDVFDASFNKVTLSGSFADPDIPDGFAPFGIRNIDGDIYVTYAKQDAAKHDDVKGRGLGFVNVFDSNGNLIRRVASKGKLNAPWGLAMASAGFGKFSNRLLVGNFGDGRINAFDVATGRSAGNLQESQGKDLKIDGLWGLSFGNGLKDQPTDVLFFTAGPNKETHGLYGFIEPAP